MLSSLFCEENSVQYVREHRDLDIHRGIDAFLLTLLSIPYIKSNSLLEVAGSRENKNLLSVISAYIIKYM